MNLFKDTYCATIFLICTKLISADVQPTSDIDELETDTYPAGFSLTGFSRLSQESLQPDFYAVFIEDHIIYYFEDLIPHTFTNNRNDPNILNMKIGDVDTEFRFYRVVDDIFTEIKIDDRKPVLAHSAWKKQGKLRIKINKNKGFRIDGQVSTADLSLELSSSVVKTSNFRDAVKLTFDTSELKDGELDMVFETPLAQKRQVPVGISAVTIYIIVAVGCGVFIVVVLIICLTCSRCPLHVQCCAKVKVKQNASKEPKSVAVTEVQNKTAEIKKEADKTAPGDEGKDTTQSVPPDPVVETKSRRNKSKSRKREETKVVIMGIEPPDDVPEKTAGKTTPSKESVNITVDGITKTKEKVAASSGVSSKRKKKKAVEKTAEKTAEKTGE